MTSMERKAVGDRQSSTPYSSGSIVSVTRCTP
jgi:hypothetical protein